MFTIPIPYTILYVSSILENIWLDYLPWLLTSTANITAIISLGCIFPHLTSFILECLLQFMMSDLIDSVFTLIVAPQ